MLRASRFIGLFGIVGLIFLSLLTLDTVQEGSSVVRTIIGMTWGLVLFWVVIGGLLVRHFRNPIRAHIQRNSLGWRVKFVLFATCIALIEEAVTVSMTNLAPIFGVRVGEAYITASANYLDVVLFHSVIVFVPMFIIWAVVLGRYDFRPSTVFLLFGLTGALSETISFGLQSLSNVGLWVFVYGLMVYLPAYALPANRGRKAPRFYHYALALISPIIGAIPVALIVATLHPVGIHFDPIR